MEQFNFVRTINNITHFFFPKYKNIGAYHKLKKKKHFSVFTI